MSESSETPDWVVVAARVFVVSRNWIAIHTIERISARAIILSNGTPFDRSSLSQNFGGFDIIRLAPLSDPNIKKQYLAQLAGAFATAVEDAAVEFALRPSDQLAVAVEAAIAEWRTAATAIENGTTDV